MDSTRRPLMLLMRSPGCKPARSAGDPGSTRWTRKTIFPTSPIMACGAWACSLAEILPSRSMKLSRTLSPMSEAAMTIVLARMASSHSMVFSRSDNITLLASTWLMTPTSGRNATLSGIVYALTVVTETAPAAPSNGSRAATERITGASLRWSVNRRNGFMSPYESVSLGSSSDREKTQRSRPWGFALALRRAQERQGLGTTTPYRIGSRKP